MRPPDFEVWRVGLRETRDIRATIVANYFWEKHLRPFCVEYRKKFGASGISDDPPQGRNAGNLEYREVRRTLDRILQLPMGTGRFCAYVPNCTQTQPSISNSVDDIFEKLLAAWGHRALNVDFEGRTYRIERDLLGVGMYITPYVSAEQDARLQELGAILVLGLPHVG